MKILIAQVSHETNTFSVARTDFEVFSSGGFFIENEMIDSFRDASDYITGMIHAAEEQNVELVPTIAIGAAGPLLLKDCLERVMFELLSRIERHKNDIDGLCLNLHGAGCAEGIDDLESYILREIRQIVGMEIPITVCLDLHGNIFPEMLSYATTAFGIKEYPHTDCVECGYLAMDTLIKIIQGKLRAKTAYARVPILLPPRITCTFQQPFLSVTEYIKAYKNQHALVDVSLFHGFTYADIPYCSASVLVTSENGDEQFHAQKVAEYVFSRRQEFVPTCYSASEAVDIALSAKGEGFAVINESSDNPGSGTPGDGTHLLAEMLKRDIPKSIFGYVVDAAAAQLLHQHTVGETVQFYLGGKTDTIHGAPLNLSAQICALSDGDFTFTSPVLKGLKFSLGKCARVRCGQVEIIIGSIHNQTYDDRPFMVTGADITEYDLIALKSANHFRAFFEPLAKIIVPADPPGISSSNLFLLNFKNVLRPIFPLDKDFS